RYEKIDVPACWQMRGYDRPFYVNIRYQFPYNPPEIPEEEKVGKVWLPLVICAAASGIALIVTTFGQDNTSPEYLGSPLNCLYGWLACLAMMGWFKTKFDTTSKFAGYMTRSSYGLYIVHYLVIASFGYMMKMYTQLPPVAMYLILGVAVFALSPLLYEVLHRIPFIRWCIFGEKRAKS
ncbi:MAG: acyltransferase family protein, partial [Bacteroidales bacterium]|nr:acyltransferase family protein [Bacteroidales bacterium]